MTDEMHDPGDIAGYRALSEDDIEAMNLIKDAVDTLTNIFTGMQMNPDLDKRCLALAITNAQQASMWGCRAIAQPTSG